MKKIVLAVVAAACILVVAGAGDAKSNETSTHSSAHHASHEFPKHKKSTKPRRVRAKFCKTAACERKHPDGQYGMGHQ